MRIRDWSSYVCSSDLKWRAIEKTPLLSIPDVLANKAIQDLLNQRAQANAALSQERAKHLEAYTTVQQLKAQVDEVNRQIQTNATGNKQSISQEYERARLQERTVEHTTELQSIMRISFAVFGLKKTTKIKLEVDNLH